MQQHLWRVLIEKLKMHSMYVHIMEDIMFILVVITFILWNILFYMIDES